MPEPKTRILAKICRETNGSLDQCSWRFKLTDMIKLFDLSRTMVTNLVIGVFLSIILAGCGLVQVRNPLAENPAGTTLERSIGVFSTPEEENTSTEGPYKRLEHQDGLPLVIRQDLAAAQIGRQQRRAPLVSFVHLTDMHITDSQSPQRLPYVRRFGAAFKTAFRNHEILSLHVADSMVQGANALSGGPATGSPFAMAIHTGDNGDSRHINELENYIAVLDGGQVNVNTSGEGYIGVQDDFHVTDDPTIYDQYYHPDPPPAGVEPDSFKREYGYPEYPGLLEAATTNFQATGLSLPWYSAYGNHDSTVYGNFTTYGYALDGLWNPLATGTIPGQGSQMLLGLPTDMELGDFLGCLTAPTPDCTSQIFETAPKRSVPANADRTLYSIDDFLSIHINSPSSPGPAGHGFTDQNVQDQTLYYTFDLAPEIVGIVLDTVNPSGGPDGALDSTQFAWLEAQLKEHNSRYIDGDSVVETGNEDKLIVLFSHHNLSTMNNDAVQPEDPNPDKVLADSIEDLVLNYPNVILWVNGHSHVNRVWSHSSLDKAAVLPTGFWEVNTASHIDYPQQARSLEIVDNQDGTLSIFAILIDHAAPPETDPERMDILGLASISRELSANDPDFDLAYQLGAPADQNVELLIDRTF